MTGRGDWTQKETEAAAPAGEQETRRRFAGRTLDAPPPAAHSAKSDRRGDAPKRHALNGQTRLDELDAARIRLPVMRTGSSACLKRWHTNLLSDANC